MDHSSPPAVAAIRTEAGGAAMLGLVVGRSAFSGRLLLRVVAPWTRADGPIISLSPRDVTEFEASRVPACVVRILVELADVLQSLCDSRGGGGGGAVAETKKKGSIQRLRAVPSRLSSLATLDLIQVPHHPFRAFLKETIVGIGKLAEDALEEELSLSKQAPQTPGALLSRRGAPASGSTSDQH